MTITEILKQAEALSPQERKELAKLLIDSLDVETSEDRQEHWGQMLNRLLDSLDMKDWEALDIDDPVEWVKQQRAQDQRLGDIRNTAYRI